MAAIAEIEGKISETRLQILTLEEEMRKEATTELREAEGEEAELVERKIVAQDQLARIDIRAPQSGIVQELAVHTVGGVIGAGETVMLIVPAADGLVVDAQIAPASIDDVEAGQPVSIRFSAFDANTTPECKGSRQKGVGRPHQGRAGTIGILHRKGRHRRRESLLAGAKASVAGHAGRGPHPDGRAQRMVLFVEAVVGPVFPSVQGIAANFSSANAVAAK